MISIIQNWRLQEQRIYRATISCMTTTKHLSHRGGIPRCVPQEVVPYNKSLTDKTCSLKMARYWPQSFLCVYEPRSRSGPLNGKNIGQ